MAGDYYPNKTFVEADRHLGEYLAEQKRRWETPPEVPQHMIDAGVAVLIEHQHGSRTFADLARMIYCEMVMAERRTSNLRANWVGSIEEKKT